MSNVIEEIADFLPAASPADKPQPIPAVQALDACAQPMYTLDKNGNVTWGNAAYWSHVASSPFVGSAPPYLQREHNGGITLRDLFAQTTQENSWVTEVEVNAPATSKKKIFQTVFTRFIDRITGDIGFFVHQNDISLQKEEIKTLWEQANHDQLTGLANASFFTNLLTRAMLAVGRSTRSLHLLMLDLDGFKQVNDLYGHQAGDEVLKTVAQRLKESIRGTDFAARLGGDEFAICLNDVVEAETVGKICQKLINVINQPILDEQGNTHRVGVSIGFAMYPLHALDEKQLKERADTAMYYAKARGKNQFANVSEVPVAKSLAATPVTDRA